MNSLNPLAAQFNDQSRKWTEHFAHNRNHMEHVPWEKHLAITNEERQAIEKSIAVFQLGESSEGNSFVRAGRAYATKTGDFEYLNALKLFIKEEQNHSAVLGRFMAQQSIPMITNEWTDSGFRFVRKLAGLNVCITVLITAEIIAAVYYRALGQATCSPVLRAICGQILIDEAHHLQFQAATLAKERSTWHPIKRWLFRQLHRVFMFATILIVAKEHGKVYRAGGLGFFQWYAMTWSVLEDVLHAIKVGASQSTNRQFKLPLPPQTTTTHVPGLPSMKYRELVSDGVSRKQYDHRNLREITALFE